MFIQILYAIFYTTGGDGNALSHDERTSDTAHLFRDDHTAVESRMNGEGEE